MTWTAALLCAALGIAGCDKSTSQATAPSLAHHQVAATVEDTTGTLQSGLAVWVVGLDPATPTTVGNTGGSGVAHFSLADGRYCVSTKTSFPTVLAAAATGRVQQQPAGHPDSILFRLVLLPGATLRGKVILSGQAVHDGTIVGLTEVLTFTHTTADGSYELPGLPPGTWTGLATQPGFQGQIFDVAIPAPGDTVQVGTVTLVPGGPFPRP